MRSKHTHLFIYEMYGSMRVSVSVSVLFFCSNSNMYFRILHIYRWHPVNVNDICFCCCCCLNYMLIKWSEEYKQQKHDYNKIIATTIRTIIINTTTLRRYTDKNNSKFNDDVVLPASQPASYPFIGRSVGRSLLTSQNILQRLVVSQKYTYFLL